MRAMPTAAALHMTTYRVAGEHTDRDRAGVRGTVAVVTSSKHRIVIRPTRSFHW